MVYSMYVDDSTTRRHTMNEKTKGEIKAVVAVLIMFALIVLMSF